MPTDDEIYAALEAVFEPGFEHELPGVYAKLRALFAQPEPERKRLELLITRAKAWHEWRGGSGGLDVHATESDLFDAVEAL